MSSSYLADSPKSNTKILILCYSSFVLRSRFGISTFEHEDLINYEINMYNSNRPFTVHTASKNQNDSFKENDIYKKHIVMNNGFSDITEKYNLVFSLDCDELQDTPSEGYSYEIQQQLSNRASRYIGNVMRLVTDDGFAFIGNVAYFYFPFFNDMSNAEQIDNNDVFNSNTNHYFKIRKRINADEYNNNSPSFETFTNDGNYFCNAIDDKLELIFDASAAMMVNIFKSIIPEGRDISKIIIHNSNLCWFNTGIMMMAFALNGRRLTTDEYKLCCSIAKKAGSFPYYTSQLESVFSSIISRIKDIDFIMAEYYVFNRDDKEIGGGSSIVHIPGSFIGQTPSTSNILFARSKNGHYQLYSHKNTVEFNRKVKAYITNIHRGEHIKEYTLEELQVLQLFSVNDSKYIKKIDIKQIAIPKKIKDNETISHQLNALLNKKNRTVEDENMIYSLLNVTESSGEPIILEPIPSDDEIHDEQIILEPILSDDETPDSYTPNRHGHETFQSRDNLSSSDQLNALLSKEDKTVEDENMIHSLLNVTESSGEPIILEPIPSDDEFKPSHKQFREKNYVSGLSSLSLYVSNEYKRRILFLCENHLFYRGLCDKRIDSINADDFLYGLIEKRSESLIDVFIESDYYFSDTKDLKFSKYMQFNNSGNPNFMHDITRNISNKNCFVNYQTDNNEVCSYRNSARFHLMDLKNSRFPIISYLVELKMLYFNILNMGSNKYIDKQITKNINDSRLTFIEFRDLGIYQNNNSSIFNNNDLIQSELLKFFEDIENNNQINQIEYEPIKEFLENKIKDIMKLNYNLIFVNIIISLIDLEIKNPRSTVRTLIVSSELINIIDKIIIIYTIARIFRKFEYNPEKINGPIKDVIIYADFYNCGIFKSFLYDLDFDKSFKAKAANDQKEDCLDITGFYEKYSNPLEFDNDEDQDARRAFKSRIFDSPY